jgi:hypothetical protein
METYLHKWYKQRGLAFIGKRSLSLLSRYSLTPMKVIEGIDSCMVSLAEFDYQPTFFVPAVIAQRYPRLIRQLHEEGSEIAVHGYHHVDLSALPVEDARDALMRSVQVLGNLGAAPRGFRGPYLGCSDALLESLPTGLFDYSSNVAICWDNLPLEVDQSPFSKTLNRLYRVKPSEKAVCTPWMHFGLVEIPTCIPDDLQLHDGFDMTLDKLTGHWCQMLRAIHERGELFTLLFHSELASVCAQPIRELFQEIKQLKPWVWVAKMSEISDWWREKSTFQANIVANENGSEISLICSARATVLARNLDSKIPGQAWDGNYSQIQVRKVQLPANLRPFVGLAQNTSHLVVSFLQEQGYILDMDEKTAASCEVYIDMAILSKLSDLKQLIEYIEDSRGCLMRYWRWPNGAKSALSVTADLDSLSLLDYAARLFVHQGNGFAFLNKVTDNKSSSGQKS